MTRGNSGVGYLSIFLCVSYGDSLRVYGTLEELKINTLGMLPSGVGGWSRQVNHKSNSPIKVMSQDKKNVSLYLPSNGAKMLAKRTGVQLEKKCRTRVGLYLPQQWCQNVITNLVAAYARWIQDGWQRSKKLRSWNQDCLDSQMDGCHVNQGILRFMLSDSKTTMGETQISSRQERSYLANRSNQNKL